MTILTIVLLGGVTESINVNSDLNNCTKAGVTYYWGASMPLNAPAANSTMQCEYYRDSGKLAQVCLYTSSASPKRWIRYQDGAGTWGEWKRIYDETILTDSTVLSSLASALKPYLEAL